MGVHGPGGSWRRNKRHPGLITCGPEMWKDMSQAAQRKEKQKWAIEKPKPDNARRLRGIYFIDPTDAEFKETIQKCAENVGSSDASSNALQDQGKNVQGTCRTLDTRKTKYVCFVEADESTRRRLEGTLHEDHEDHIAGKGLNSVNHYNLAHKLIPMPKAMKIPDAKVAVENAWENSRKYRHGSWRKSETKKRWSMKQGKKATPCTSRH